jgi:hypothetical protein
MRSTFLWIFLGLGATLWQPAQAQYVPNLTILRTSDRFHVQADGRYTQTMEMTLRVDTPQGVASDGERKITFNEKLETHVQSCSNAETLHDVIVNTDSGAANQKKSVMLLVID